MTASDGQTIFWTHIVGTLPSLAFLVVGVVCLVLRKGFLAWFPMALGAAILQAVSWVGFCSAWSRTEAAGREGVLALERAITENIQYGFLYSLIGVAGWSLVVFSVVYLARESGRGSRDPDRKP